MKKFEYLFLLLKLLLLTKFPKIGFFGEVISSLITEFKPLSSLKNLGNMYACHKAIIATQKTTLTPAKPKSKNLKFSILFNFLIKFNLHQTKYLNI